VTDTQPTGFAYHGDFMTGWEESFLQQALDTCRSDTGLQSDCPLFKLQSDDEARACKMPVPPVLAGEDVFGPGMLKLPGNPVLGASIPQQVAPVESVGYSPAPPGQVFKADPTVPAPAETQAPAPTAPDVNLKAAETSTAGPHVVTEVVWEQAVVYVTEEVDVVQTVTVDGPPPQKVKARGHLRRHQHHGHGHF
jgi:hypothetical protein